MREIRQITANKGEKDDGAPPPPPTLIIFEMEETALSNCKGGGIEDSPGLN